MSVIYVLFAASALIGLTFLFLFIKSVKQAGEGEVTSRQVAGKLGEIVTGITKVSGIVSEIAAAAPSPIPHPPAASCSPGAGRCPRRPQSPRLAMQWATSLGSRGTMTGVASALNPAR